MKLYLQSFSFADSWRAVISYWNKYGNCLGGLYHYENMPMQYTAFFQGCKNDNFQMKNCDIFLIFAQNIVRWYTLEPPH